MLVKAKRSVTRPDSIPDQTNLIRDKMGEASFEALSELFKQHPKMSDMRKSPPPEELEEFCRLLKKMPYVQGLFEFGRLREAIDLLEKGYQAYFSLYGFPVTDTELKLQMRMERKVRFIKRMAVILGPAYGPIDIPDNVQVNMLLAELVEPMTKVENNLTRLLDLIFTHA